MAILNETSGQVTACDGCGRTDAGPSHSLDVQSYTVHDPNVGGQVLRHYCAGCASARGSVAFETLTVLEPRALNVVAEDEATD